MPITSSISLYRGEDRNYYFGFVPPINISGFTFEFNAARRKDMASKFLTIPCVITDAINGVFRVTITEALADVIRPGSYFWDAWRTDLANKRIVGIGKFDVIANVREPN